MSEKCCPVDNNGRDLALVRVLHMGARRFSQDYGHTQEAEHLFKTALMVLEHVDDEHPQKAETLARLKLDLGSLYYELMGKLAEADSVTRECLTLSEQAFGADHHITGYACNNLADIHALQGRYAEADEFYRRAIRILDKDAGPVPGVLKIVLTAHAATLRLAGREDDARQVDARVSAEDSRSQPQAGSTDGDVVRPAEPVSAPPAADAAPTDPARFDTSKQA